MQRPQRIVGVVLAALVGTTLGFGRAPRTLPLGPPGLPETRLTRVLAPGLTYRRYVHGRASRRDFWTVDVDFAAARARAEREARRLRRGHVAAQVVPILERAQDDPARGPLGFLVRAGHYASEAAAKRLRDRLAGRGYPKLPRRATEGERGLDFSGEDGGPTTGPWVVSVLELDPARFSGVVRPALATDVVPGLEPLSRLAKRRGALAGTNGGYFIMAARDGTPGDLAGLSVIDGQVVSEAADDRTCLLLPSQPHARAAVAAVITRMLVRAQDAALHALDGRNRSDRAAVRRLLRVDHRLGVVNGGPRLLRDGRVDVPAMAEGFSWSPEFFYRFGVRRHPRTLAGVTSDGHLLLVTVDGRAPGHSIGASFRESARLMRALGAANAVNLDGGGSTTMVVDGRRVTRPSDPGGERSIGDAVLIFGGSPGP